MADDQRHGRIFGVLFIITFLTSIPAYLIFESVFDDPAAFIGGDGGMGWLYFAIVLEFFLVPRISGRASSSFRSRSGKTKVSRWASSRLESSRASSSQSGSSSCSGS